MTLPLQPNLTQWATAGIIHYEFQAIVVEIAEISKTILSERLFCFHIVLP